MDKSEPALLPEWLKSSGSVAASGSASHLSPYHADDHHVPKNTRNKSSLSISDSDLRRSSVLERITSSYFRRSSNSSSSAHLRSYSSFGRRQRDRDWEDVCEQCEKEKSVLGDHGHYEFSDPLGNNKLSRFDNDILCRTQAMKTEKHDYIWPRKVAGDLTNSNKNSHSNDNGLPAKGGPSPLHKAKFEQDFPVLGAEERQGSTDIGKFSSPVSSTATQISTGTSVVVGSDSWKSALAEVSGVTGSSGVAASLSQLAGPPAAAFVAPIITAGLNMAETLAQGPSRARTPPQQTVGTQRFEELAIRQSKLIPVTPSSPKPLVVNPLEKSKSKNGPQQHPLHFVNHTRGSARADFPKTSNEGRLQVLKPLRDLNGFSSIAKDSFSPANGSKVVNSPLSITPSAVGSLPLWSSSNATTECHSSVFRSTVEKRATSQAQSRSDFFNHLKKKYSANSTSAVSDPSPIPPPSILEKFNELVTEVPGASANEDGGDASSSEVSNSGLSSDDRSIMMQNGDACSGCQGFFSSREKTSRADVTPNPDDEEAAFLRSLGWEENAGEDEGLTEEEISAFYKEYMKLRPSSKLLHGMQQTLTIDARGGSSSGLSSSDSRPDS